ncbi:MAG: thiamine phosphate synthase [Phycisphaeraceae bacterium]|nr:thiamine phosphate synthase [Phycisphaeraceae bacterium]MCB9846989.1 thiamine phosphate synthase [Phycisphaeraceae bacterium]
MPPADPATLRILDAAANRAAEGLRVLEDIARFALDDAALTTELKTIRHGVRETLTAAGIDPARLIACRDTPGDVGTRIETPSERSRPSRRAVADAAAGRAAEALRSIEETLKQPAPQAAVHAESLRYRLYEAHRRLSLAQGADRAGFTGWRLCALITESLCARPWLEVAERAIAGGADCVQLREKALSDAELLRRARALVDLAHPLGAGVVINDRPDIALLAGADGVHVGQGDLDVASIRRLAGASLLVGVSASTIEQATAARAAGADSCGVGAMFPTTTKRKDEIAGPALLRDYLAHEPALPPALAIGGITPANLGGLIAEAGAGPFGVAVSSAICGADDPEVETRSIRSQLDHTAVTPRTQEPPCPSSSSRQPSTTG